MNTRKSLQIFNILSFTVVFAFLLGCEKDNSTEWAERGSKNTVKNPSEVTDGSIDNTGGEYVVPVKKKHTPNYNNKVDEPQLQWYWDLEDINCPDAGENCGDPVVIVPSALGQFRNAVDGDKTDVRDFFLEPNNWSDLFPWLSNEEWVSKLNDLQSGDFDIEEFYNEDLDKFFYVADDDGAGTFVIQIEEDDE